MHKILILSETKNDLACTILNTCPNAEWFALDAQGIEFGCFDSVCILGGDREKPLTLSARLRMEIDKMREARKPIFCEFVTSMGPVCEPVSQKAIKTSHHRLLYSSEYVAVDGLKNGSVLDGHYNELISYFFIPQTAKPILTYHDYICAHDVWETDVQTFREGKWALWTLDEHTMMASFRLCNFNRARLAPSDFWRKILTHILCFLAGGKVQPVFPKLVCTHQGQAVREVKDIDHAVNKGLQWFFNADIFVNDGKDGALEGFSHLINARNGQQFVADWIRADCTGEAGGAFLLDFLTTGNKESLVLFENTAEFCFEYMQIKNGKHQGMLRWTENAWESCYQDDVARAILPTLLFENFGKGSKYFQNAVDALAYLVKSTGEDGLRVARTERSRLTNEELQRLQKSGVGTPCAHFNAYYHAALLLAVRAGAPKEFGEVAKKGLSSIMALYPNTQRETSETEEMCRLILPLALLYEYTKDEMHYKWLLRVTNDLERVQHVCGGYAEWDTGYQANCARKEKGECALLANNGDPIADLLYSNNWLPLAFAYAYMVTGEEAFYQKWLLLCEFLCRCQICSEDKLLDGAWMRAIDMNRMEAYGVPHDIGWAPCCIESGWTVAEILMGMQFMRIAKEKVDSKK